MDVQDFGKKEEGISYLPRPGVYGIVLNTRTELEVLKLKESMTLFKGNEFVEIRFQDILSNHELIVKNKPKDSFSGGHIQLANDNQLKETLEKDSLWVGLVRSNTGFFLPGGGIEKGEDYSRCLKREFLEETGYDVAIGDFILEANFSGFTPNSKIYVTLNGHFYLATIKDYLGKTSNENEIFIWMSVQDALNKLHLEHQRIALKKALEIIA